MKQQEATVSTVWHWNITWCLCPSRSRSLESTNAHVPFVALHVNALSQWCKTLSPLLFKKKKSISHISITDPQCLKCLILFNTYGSRALFDTFSNWHQWKPQDHMTVQKTELSLHIIHFEIKWRLSIFPQWKRGKPNQNSMLWVISNYRNITHVKILELWL